MTTLDRVLTPANDAVEVRPGETYPNFGILSFSKGLFKKKPLSGDETSAGRLYRVPTGQFGYGRLNAYECAFAVVSDKFSGCHVSSAFLALDCDTDELRSEFLHLLCSQPAKGLGSPQATCQGQGRRRWCWEPANSTQRKRPSQPGDRDRSRIPGTGGAVVWQRCVPQTHSHRCGVGLAIALPLSRRRLGYQQYQGMGGGNRSCWRT